MQPFNVIIEIATQDRGSNTVELVRLSESSHKCVTWAYDFFSDYVILGLKVKPVKEN